MHAIDTFAVPQLPGMASDSTIGTNQARPDRVDLAALVRLLDQLHAGIAQLRTSVGSTMPGGGPAKLGDAGRGVAELEQQSERADGGGRADAGDSCRKRRGRRRRGHHHHGNHERAGGGDGAGRGRRGDAEARVERGGGAPEAPPEAAAAAGSGDTGAGTDAAQVGTDAGVDQAAPAEDVNANEPPAASGFVKPVDAAPGSPFGAPRSSGPHKGLDFAADPGTPIRAAAAGTVVESKPLGSYGNQVLIDHGDGRFTRYAHMQSPSPIAEGQAVVAGEEIGKVGTTGVSTGPHLHFEIHVGGKGNVVDPAPYVAGDAAF